MDISRQKEATPQRWRLGLWAALGLSLVAAGLLGGCRALRHQGAMPEADAVRILTATQAQTPVTTATSLPVSASTPTAIAREDKARQRQPEPTPTETVLSAGPRLEESGAYEFQAEHPGGQYYLHRTGDLVTATLKNPSGPCSPHQPCLLCRQLTARPS